MGSLCPFKLLCWELLLPLHLPLKEEAGDTLLETSRDALVRHQVYWHLQCGRAAPETQRSKRFSGPPRRWRQSKRRHQWFEDSIPWLHIMTWWNVPPSGRMLNTWARLAGILPGGWWAFSQCNLSLYQGGYSTVNSVSDTYVHYNVRARENASLSISIFVFKNPWVHTDASPQAASCCSLSSCYICNSLQRWLENVSHYPGSKLHCFLLSQFVHYNHLP